MSSWQNYTVPVIVVLLAVGVLVVLHRRRGDTFARLERRLPATPRHRAEPISPVIYREVGGVFVVVHAPDRAFLPVELVTRARNGSWPNLAYQHDEIRGDVLTFGTHEQGAGKVVYQLAGRVEASPELVSVVRVA